MQRLIIKIKDDSKSDIFVKFLKDLEYIEITEEETKKGSVIGRKRDSLKNIYGIWKQRGISSEQIRSKAWARNR
jgi:hypothetical protein